MKPSPIPVLLYHGVDRVAAPRVAPWVMHPQHFEMHLDRIVAAGYSTLTVSHLRDCLVLGRPLPRRTLVLTFDDGFADFATHAWPALRHRGLAATLYVTSGLVGGRAEWLAGAGEPVPRMLDADQVRMLHGEGCEIGAHGVTHAQLDTLTRARLQHEVRHSRHQLSQMVGAPIRSFAYPHGYYGSRVRRAVIDAGYESACAVRQALSSATDDPFGIARITLRSDDVPSVLDDALAGRGPVAPFPERLRTRAGRVYRRTRSRLGAR